MSGFQDNLSQCLFALMMLLALTGVNAQSQEPDLAADQSARELSATDSGATREITNILTTQAACWNREDIDAFMETYWKSDQLTFSGGGNTTRGWQATLDRYKKSYPKGSMGNLKFDNLEISILGTNASLVLGNWYLEIPSREGKAKKQGNFSLVLRKLDGSWKIIHDHSSTLEPKKQSGEESQTGQGTEKK